MYTISKLAKKCGISRTTILYYEREGLLLPKSRSDNGYRWYGDAEIERLEAIMAYRSFGVPVAQLHSLLEIKSDQMQEQVLVEQFNALESQIKQFRLQQKAIVQFLKRPDLLDEKVVSVERWTQIMRDAGLSDDDMKNWHIQFESTDPDGHQRFLQTLNIDDERIKQIRSWATTTP